MLSVLAKNRDIKKFLEKFGVFPDPIVGIDISSSAVKVMELGRKNNRFFVQNFALEPLKVGDVVEKNIKRKDSVIKALTKAINKAKISSELSCISIPNSYAVSKIIQLEQGIDDKEIANEIELEADRYIPYDLDDVNLDFEILGPSNVGHNLMDVILVATKKENVRTRVGIVEDSGLQVKIVDVESLSIERVFYNLIAKDLPDGGSEKLIMLFDVGANITSINVYYNLRLIYNKEQNFGGQQLLDEIQKRYGLTLEEAILARKYGDLPDDYQLDVLDPYRYSIAQNIARAAQLFISSSEHNKIDYVCLTGGSSNIPGIDDAVQELLQVKTIIVNPIKDLLVSKNVPVEVLAEESMGLLNCFGLALRNFKDLP
jgi:type IV pilus assembly protein PilM